MKKQPSQPNLEIPEIVSGSGILALFMQFSHPLVAAGVASTGEFQKNPRERLQRTARVLERLTGGNQEQTKRLSAHIANQHAQIHGVLSEDVGQWRAGTAYAATDPELLLWVYATLIVSRVHVYSTFIRPLSDEEQEQFYKSTFSFGDSFGVTEAIRPATYKDLMDYYAGMLIQVAVGREGHILTTSLIDSLGNLSAVVRFITIGLMPDAARRAYGFRWNWYRSINARICGVVVIKLLALKRKLSKP